MKSTLSGTQNESKAVNWQKGIAMNQGIRLTEAVRATLLTKNEGFTTSTSYDSKNHSYVRKSLIEAGKLIIREIGKTSWSDSRYDKTWVADSEEVRRFLRNNINVLKR